MRFRLVRGVDEHAPLLVLGVPRRVRGDRGDERESFVVHQDSLAKGTVAFHRRLFAVQGQSGAGFRPSADDQHTAVGLDIFKREGRRRFIVAALLKRLAVLKKVSFAIATILILVFAYGLLEGAPSRLRPRKYGMKALA